MQPRVFEIEYHLSHRHKDGSYADMEEVHHSSASHDGERLWGIKRLFKCKTCDEWATIMPGGEPDAIEQR